MYKLIIICLIICLILKNQKQYLYEPNKLQSIRCINENITIIDNFYKFPEKIREFALKNDFKDHNTIYHTSYFNPMICSKKNKSLINTFKNIGKKSINLENWDHNILYESNGFFQYITENSKPTIHHDNKSKAVIIFLSPNGGDKGTSFYQHKETGVYKNVSKEEKIKKEDCLDKTKWNKYFTCENVFNRALIFDGYLYHCSEGGFGNNKDNARLYQTFFF